MPLLDRTGWTATASSTYDTGTPGQCAPGKALDGINVQNNSFWISDHSNGVNDLFPHWIAVDMLTPREISYLKYVPALTRFFTPIFWGQNVPCHVRAYVSNDGANWTLVGEQVWPDDNRTHYVYFTENGVLTAHTARYFKLEGVTDLGHGGALGTGGYHRMACAEIYAGKLEEGDDYKVYWKAHPKTLEDLTPFIEGAGNNGQVDYLSLQIDPINPTDLTLAHLLAAIRVWHTSGLAWYPEFCCTFWDFPTEWHGEPIDWKDLPLETVSVFVEGRKLDAASVGTAYDFGLIDHRGSTQGLFDFLGHWAVDFGDFDPRVGTMLFNTPNWEGDLTAAALETCYSNLLIMASIHQTAPSHADADVSRLIVEGHYFLVVYGDIYTAPEEGGGDEGGGDEGGGFVAGRNDAMLLIDLSPARGGVA